MSPSAWQQIVFVLAMVLVPGCSKISVSKVSSSSGRLDNATKTTEPRNDEDSEQKNEEPEQVVPPNKISGTYLACEATRDANATLNQATILCALRDDKTQSKADLATFVSHEWKITMPELSTVTSTMQELSSDSAWHVELQIKAGSAIGLDLALQGVRVTLIVQSSGGTSETQTASIATAVTGLQWTALNGGAIPASTVPGGSEHMGRDILSLCRVYAQGGVYPGKLQPTLNNPNRSVCNSVRDNATIRSQSEDGRTELGKTDALQSGTKAWTELLEWTTIVAPMALPKNAFVGGMDDRGEALLVCRGLEAGPAPNITDKPNDIAGEWTPGYVKASDNVCQHEYYGSKNSLRFQVLVWKTP